MKTRNETTREETTSEGGLGELTALSTDRADGLVRLCRTVVGDGLRSVIHFTPRDFELLYLRRDLYTDDPDQANAVKTEVVNNERLGFASVETYGNQSEQSALEPAFGEYEFTVRVFKHGFVSRVVVGTRGILLTTDDIDIARFEELAVAIRRLLEDLPA